MVGFEDLPIAGGRLLGFSSFFSSVRGDWRGSTPLPRTGDGNERTGRGARTDSKGFRFFSLGRGFFFRSIVWPSWGLQAIARPWPGAGDQAMARHALLSTAEDNLAAAEGGA
jgi:hypothetical protein